MKFGVGLPHEAGGDLRLVLDYAKRAEEEEFDSVVMADHVFFENEVLTTLTAVAMKTERLRLIPFVLDGNRRDPATLAHMTATLDRLSGGRLILGIGKGIWNEAYYGFEVREPVSRMEETIELLKRFWAGEEVNHASRFFKFNKAQTLKAKPLQKPHPPIWVAAFGERMLEIALRLGNGFITQNMPPLLFKRTLDDAKAKNRGRRSSRFEAVYGCMPVAIARNREDARRLIEASARSFLVRHAMRLCPEMGYDEPWSNPGDIPQEAIDECFVFGTPSDVESRVEEYLQAGASYMVFQQVLPIGFESLKMLTSVLSHFS